MIKFVVARFSEADYNNYIGFSLKKTKAQIACCDIHHEGNQHIKGLGGKFNKGIEAFVKSNLDDQDIVCFCHEDVKIVDPIFTTKLEMVFREKTDVGMVGVAGATELPENFNWFMGNPENIKGHWIQDNNSKTIHMKRENIGYFDDIVVVHKFFFAVRGILLKDGLRFDESLIGHDLYNVDFGLQVLNKGYKLAVADIMLLHKSSRENNGNVKILNKKWTDLGFTYPITNKQFSVNVEDNGVEILI